MTVSANVTSLSLLSNFLFAGANDFTHSTCLIESSLLELGEGGVSSPTAVKGNVLARKPWH